jgi:phosphatidylglycerophosphate synthase
MAGPAVLTIPSTETALARVAGLPLVRRNVLALGADNVTVVSEDPRILAALHGLPVAIASAVPDGARVVIPCDRVVGIEAPCRTPAERKEAERQLFRGLRKSVDGPVSRWINRPVSLSVTRLVLDTNITPNQMTVVATLIGAAGIAAVLSATWTGVAVGAILVQLQSILDGCDGEIARLKFQASAFGAWLDNVLDDIVNAAFGLALGIASATLLGNPLWRGLGVFAAVAFAIYYAVVYAQLFFVHKTGNPFAFRWWFQTSADLGAELASAGGAGARVGSALRSLARRDVFLLAFMILAILRLPQIAVVWYAILGAAYLTLSLLHLAKGGLKAEAAP